MNFDYVTLAQTFYFRNVSPFLFSKNSPNLGNQIQPNFRQTS